MTPCSARLTRSYLKKALSCFGDDFERETLRRDGLHAATLSSIVRPVRQQTQRDLSDVVDRAREPATVRESEAIDRAISAHARNAAEQRVARDLPRNKTGIELENDFVPGDFPKVIGIGKLSIEHAQFFRSESDSGEQARAFAAIEIEDGDRFAGLLAQLVARPTARRDDFARGTFHSRVPMKIPERSPIGREKSQRRSSMGYGVGMKATRSAAAANRPIEIRGFRRRRDATIRPIHDAHKTREPRRIAQLIGDLVKSCFL